MEVINNDEKFEMKTRERQQSSESYRIIIVPGNPGLCVFYKEFVSTLFFSLMSHLNGDLTVTALSHKGHWSTREPRWYSYQEQMAFKKQQLLELVPAGSKVILIGHSIGCHMCLHLMDDSHISEHCSIEQAILLFPTIERLAISPRGLYVTPVTGWLFQWFSLIFTFAISLIPQSVRYRVLEFLFRLFRPKTHVDECIFDGAVKLMTPGTLPQVLRMANHEFAEINDLDVPLFKRCLDRLVVCYGKNDPWCPRSYYWDMCDRFPQARGTRLLIFEENYPHAFIVGAGKEVAEYCARLVANVWFPNDEDLF